LEKSRTLLQLESIRDRSKRFDPLSEAIRLSEEVKKKGAVLKDYENSERANKVAEYLESLLAYSLEESQNYGVLVVRNTEVNVFSYWNPISEEEENEILERRKRELWNKHSKKQPAWYKKYREQQEEKRKQESKYRK
jgi:hypothetical protein